MLRLISFLMLLIISQLSSAETIAAIPTTSTIIDSSSPVLGNCHVRTPTSKVGYNNDVTKTYADCLSWITLNESQYGNHTITILSNTDTSINFGYQGVFVGYWGHAPVYKTLYSCGSGYFLSDSAGNADSSGQYCTKEINICEQRQSTSDYILGTGYYLFGSSSSVCYDGCSYTNSDSKGYSVANLTYTDHTGLRHSCSVASGSGSYYTANGSKCGSTGDAKTTSTGTYPSMQAAYTACFADFIVADKAYEDAKSGVTPTTSSATSTDTPDNCAYGSSHGTFNGETISYCLSAPSTNTTTSTTTNDDGSTTTTTTTTETKTDSNGNTTTVTHNTNVTNNVDGSTTTTSSSTTSTSSNGSSSGSGSGSGSASGASGTDSSEEQVSGDCQVGELGKVSCLDVGDASAMNSDSLDSETKEVSYSVDGRFGSSGGTCPFGSITFDGHTYNQFAVVCDGVVLFKAIFLTICSIAAAFIVFGFRGGD